MLSVLAPAITPGQAQDLEASWEEQRRTVCIRLEKARSFSRTENSILILVSSVLGLAPGRHLTGVDGPDWIGLDSVSEWCLAVFFQLWQRHTETDCDVHQLPRKMRCVH